MPLRSAAHAYSLETELLLKIAALTDTPILLSPKDIKAVRAKEVRGTFSLKEALEIALHCTGLRAHINDHAVITVVTDNASKCGLHQEGVAMSQKNIGRAVGKLAAVVAVSGNLEAQPNTTQDTDDNVLEEVVVTAQKRAQSLRDVPVSVTAISVNDINAFLDGGVSIKALAARAPSLNVNGNSGRFLPQFYIRGLGNADFDVNANQPVSLIIDDVSIESTTLRSIPIFDVAQVEVLNGPQGTLFGRNTNAGIVKIDSVKPAFEQDGYLAVSAGSRRGRGVDFAIGDSLTEKVAARFSFHYLGQADWIDNLENGPGHDLGGFSQYAARVQFLFQPSARTDLLLKLQGSRIDSNTPVFYANALTPGIEGTRPGFDETTVTQDAQNFQELDHFGVSLKVNHEFDTVSLSAITSYDTLDSFSQADVDGGVTGGPEAIGMLGQQAFFGVATGDGFDDYYQISQELRFAVDRDKWFMQFGGYFFQEDFLVRSEDFGANRTSFVDQKTTSYAAFSQIEYQVTNHLSLTGGIRLTDDGKRLETIDVALPATIDIGDTYLSWDLAARYNLADDWTVFTRVARGSRGPVTLGRFGFTSTASTETLTSYEAGLKSTLFGGTARWNLTGYLYNIKDQQLTAVGQTDNVNALLNVDRTRGYGFETDFEYQITDRLYLGSNLSYNHTEIRDEMLAESICGGVPACTSPDPVRSVDPGPFGPVTNVLVNGNPLPLAPAWIFNVGLNYTHPLPDGDLYVRTDWNYKGRANIFLYESVEFVSEARWLGGVRLGYRHEDTGIDIAFVGRNITNEVTVFNGLAFLNMAATVTDPRYFGVEIKLDF